MSRLVALVVLLAARTAAAQPLDPGTTAAILQSQQESDDEDADLADQAVNVQVGIASGGRVTPGGFRLVGHFLYQLSSSDWFDGTAAFTFGGGDAACFRDRENTVVCDHGLAAGKAIELGASVRRMFARQGTFRPFARVGVGASLVRFAADGLTGLGLPVYAGAGMRAKVRPAISVVVEAGLSLGLGFYTRELGAEPLVGVAITAGAEFDL